MAVSLCLVVVFFCRVVWPFSIDVDSFVSQF